MKIKWAFDLDETLVDLTSPIKEIFKRYNKKYYPSKDWDFYDYPKKIRNEIFNLFSNKEVMCNLRAFNNSKKLIKFLLDNGQGVIVITARIKKIAKETIQFVKDTFGIDCIVVGREVSKTKVIKDLGITIYVDDKAAQLEELQREVNNVFLIMVSNKGTKYNHYLRKSIYTVKNMTELYHKVRLNNGGDK